MQNTAYHSLWFTLTLLASLIFSPCGYAQDNLANQEKAQFAIHLFQNGQPIQDAEIMISSQSVERSTTEKIIFEAIPATYSWKVNSDTPLKTDANGSLAGKLPPGAYQIHIKTKEQTFSFDLPLQSAEDAQILVTFFSGNKKPLLNIESSAAGTMAGADGNATVKRDLGNGLLRLQVVSAETGKPVKDVQVFLSGLKDKFRTDEQGMLSATVPVGSYSVSLLHSAYSSQTQDEVKIENDHKTNLNFKLTPAGVELAEYVVLEPHLAGTIASVIEEQRTATSVSTVMGAEQFSRAGDSDVAVALRRASGLTLVGGQYIFIRGLGERYSTTLVNGAAVPSPDPTRRVVPLDLFPTNILESVVVQKTYSPDRQAEFAGGTIELRTRGVPDSFFFNLNLQTGVNDRTTFQDGLSYKGGGVDFTGYDDGARAMPDALADATKQGNLQPASAFNPNGVTPGRLESLGEGLSDVWDVNKQKKGPDRGFQASMGDSFTFGDFRWGYIAAGAWKQEFRKQNEINREYQSERLSRVQNLDVQRSLSEVHITGYAATELEYKDTHKLFARTMFLRQTIDEARVSQGFTDAETTPVRKTKLRFFSNQLLMNQFGGEHRFDRLKDFFINWLYTDATANRDEPKTRDYRYDVSQQTDQYIFSQRVDSNVITYADLVDKDRSWRVDGKLPWQITPFHKVTFSGGMITQEKNRQAGAQRFSYYRFGRDASNAQVYSQSSLESILQPQYIGANGYQLRDVTRQSDQYHATQNLLMYYGKLDLLSYDKVNITGGLRWEDNDQRVHTITTGNIPTTATLNRVDMLPSVVATVFLTDKQQLRAGFSQTISRPDFRELAAAPFLDMNTNQETIGNPFLKQTSITNWDARWEYYLSPTENLFAGFFWKDLKNPIELITLAGNVGLNTYQNIDKAKVYGFEMELLKKLDFVHPFLENFYVGGNYTWSLSNAKLNAENLVVQTTNDRPLQGHSQHIVNFQLGYDNPKWKTQATLLYNVASQRIMAAGVLNAPDKYEQPFHQLDFVVSQNLYKGVSTQITMQNLLDDDVLVLQGDEIARQFRRGRVFNLNLRLAY